MKSDSRFTAVRFFNNSIAGMSVRQSAYGREYVEMDINRINGDGYGTGEIPMGLGMNLMMNQAAMQGYAGLTESEKEHLIMRCRDAGSKEEMQRIVDEMAPGTDVRAIVDEEKDGKLF